ncbi:MAG: GAF domain-containing protein, partial [Saprospiraceae bacterium]|nr:GAF domain-containing protein [Saprospiraceae bacterium]
MAASATMPYFIKASKNLDKNEKHINYQALLEAVDANLAGEDNLILKMSTINSLLKTFIPYCYWVGFYILDQGKLKVGPYQGTLGCLHIELSRGVCGKAAREKKTQIVDNVHNLQQGTAHIACDPNSQSEIVLP